MSLAETVIKTDGIVPERPPLSLQKMVWLRFRRHKLAMIGGLILILLFVYCFGGALFFSEKDANKTTISLRLSPPSVDHPFGTDMIGRDIFRRTIYGGQISLLIGITSAFVMVSIGVIIGSVAGFFGGWVDSILMRITEAMMSIPRIFLLLVMAKFFSDKFPDMKFAGRTFSGSVVGIIIMIGLTSWMDLARIIRAEYLRLKEYDFVVAARATGTPTWEIIFRHILPNTIAPVVVAATLGVASAILGESYISFLGMGVMPPTATWGNMLERSYTFIEKAPWFWIFPGFFILLTILSVNFVGDGLRDALDPRSRPM
jgi:peptide/nickel transport system permease protein